MIIKQKLENILKSEIIDIKETGYGITNKNYIVTSSDNKKYFCRVSNDSVVLSNKYNELESLKILKSEDYFLDIIYYDSNLLITNFKPGAKTFISNKNLSSIVKISNILKKFHNSKFKINNKFDPVEIFERYIYQISNFKYDIDKYMYLVNDFKKYYNPDRLCHNDLKEGNFLFADQKIYMIDYEYSGMNDYYFDIASFISENDLNYEQTITFLKSYFNSEVCNFEKLDIFLRFADLLWYTWAWLLYEKSQEEKYKTIAEEKYNKLKKPRKIIF